MPLWNLANPDYSVALNVDAFDSGKEDGSMTGTITYQGTVYYVSGGWTASRAGIPATAFALTGSSQVEPPSFVAATGIMTGPGSAPTQIDFRMGVSYSSDGNLDHYSGVLVPSIVRIDGLNTNPYQSSELPSALQSLTASTPVAVTIFNNHIYVLSDGSLSAFDLKNMIPGDSDVPGSEISGAVADPDKWTSVDFPNVLINFWHQDRLSKCSLASTPDALYLLINSVQDNINQFMAYKYELEGGWVDQDFSLLAGPRPHSGGYLSPGPGVKGDYRSDVTSTVFGDNIVIFACAQALGGSDGKQQGGVFLGIYDTRDLLQFDLSWGATWTRFLPMADYVVDSVTTEWFSTTSKDGELQFYIVVYGSTVETVSHPAKNTLVWYIPFTVSKDDKGGTVLAPSEPSAPGIMKPQYGEGDVISTLVRDPAGRVRGWGSAMVPQAGSGYLSGHILETLEPPTSATSPACPFVRERLVVSDTLIAPSSLFYIFTQGQSQTTIPVPGQSTSKPATEYPVYELIFYGSPPKLQLNRYGTIQVAQNYSIGAPKVSEENIHYIFGGIIDGPIPIPLENYVDYNLGETEKVAGTLVYGSSNTQITSREVTNKWAAGFKSSGKATQGIGPAWDIAINGGMGSVSGNEEKSTLSNGLNISAKITAQQGATPASINPLGTLQLVGAQFSISAFRFLDRFGKPVSDATTSEPGQSPKAATVLTTLQANGSASFDLYSVNPGHLMSYTPEALNQTMYDLGYRDPNKPKEVANYYGEVIYANAYPFDENKPYLEFSWSSDSGSQQSYTQFKSTYTENSWTYDVDVYVGVSLALGVSIFGIGEEMESEFLGGASYTNESTETENKDSEWGISLDQGWGPPSRDQMPGTVSAYTFRLFFLPVPKLPSKLPQSYWIQELIQHMPPGSPTPGSQIDPNSSCWRIVFVVTDIQTPDGKGSYQYLNNYLDTSSVYE